MLQIIDLKNNDIFTPISSQESATLLGGITGINLANLQDGMGNLSTEMSWLSMDNNKLFTLDMSRLTINLVMVMPSGIPEILSWTNGI
jgi:hypothetical protein